MFQVFPWYTRPLRRRVDYLLWVRYKVGNSQFGKEEEAEMSGICDRETFYFALWTAVPGGSLVHLDQEVLGGPLEKALIAAKNAEDGPHKIAGINWETSWGHVGLEPFAAELIFFGLSTRLVQPLDLGCEMGRVLAHPNSRVMLPSWTAAAGRAFHDTLYPPREAKIARRSPAAVSAF